MDASPDLAQALVEPWDGPLRFLVHSASRDGEKHGVDLAGHLNNGTCQCENFTFVQTKAIHAKEPGWHRCRHIKLAREFLVQRVVEIMAANTRQPDPHNWDHDPSHDPTPEPEPEYAPRFRNS